MKSHKEFRTAGYDQAPDGGLKKPVKLSPIKKSGKDRHSLYSLLDDDEDDLSMGNYKKHESVLDYFDDIEEDSEIEDDAEDDWDEQEDDAEDEQEDDTEDDWDEQEDEQEQDDDNDPK